MMNHKGADRAEQPGCPLFCPGCHDRQRSPEERLAEKVRFMTTVLSPWQDRIATVREADFDRRRGYREKVCLSAQWRDQGWQLGFIKRQQLVPVHHCPQHTSRVNDTLNLLAGVLPPAEKFPLAFYLQSGAQVTLVVKDRHMPDMSWLNAEVKDGLQSMGNDGLWLHLHPSTGRRVTAKNKWHLVWGKPRSTDRTGLVYGPTAFQQLLPELARAALDVAETHLSLKRNDFVLDLYCGIGSSLRRWNREECRVVGVEINGESVDCARTNAPAATILIGAGRHRLPQLMEMLPPNRDQRLLYANPPRMGIEPEIMDWIVDGFRPRRIACLSCNAVSLKKDMKRLTGAGYKVAQIVPYDFFPGTRYLEMMALLISKGK